MQRPLRHDAFDVLTPEAAYWLGVMFTDGTINRRTSGQPAIALGLQQRDRGTWSSSATSSAPIMRLRKSPQSPASSAQAASSSVFTAISRRLADHLDDLGRYGPAVDSGLAASRDFWRGCIDGDGCLNVSCGIPSLKLFGSEWLLGTFVEFLHSAGLRRSANGRPVNVRPCQSIFAVGTGGMTAVRITRLLYSDAVVALDRKAVTAAKIAVMEPPFIWPCNR